MMFDFELLKSLHFNIPIISVGNITIGGTGKTTHVEYLVSILKENYKIAILSRGYKRKDGTWSYQYWCKLCHAEIARKGRWWKAKLEDVWWNGLELWGRELLLDIEELNFELDYQELMEEN